MNNPYQHRHTRVQLVIVEHGQFVLLNHLAIRENQTFWGLPGGGVEEGETDEVAAVREAKEETGLDICLLPIRFELELQEKRILYQRIITFLAFPVGGIAQKGIEPEAEIDESYNYRLLDLKWHNFYDDKDLDPFVLESLIPIRHALTENGLVQKAGAVVYRTVGGALQVLLISTRRDSSVWVLPQGHVDPGESPAETAIRETREEVGVEIAIDSDLGFYLSEQADRICQTDLFSAQVIGVTSADEERQQIWLHADEIESTNIPIQSRRAIQSFLRSMS